MLVVYFLLLLSLLRLNDCYCWNAFEWVFQRYNQPTISLWSMSVCRVVLLLLPPSLNISQPACLCVFARFSVFNVFITLDLRFSLSIFCCWCCYCCRSAVGNQPKHYPTVVRILGSSLWKKYVHKTSETCVLSKNKFFFQSMEIFFFILKRTSLY